MEAYTLIDDSTETRSMREIFLNEKEDGLFIRVGLKNKFENTISSGPKKSFRKARAENIKRMKIHLMFRENDAAIDRLRLRDNILSEGEIPSAPSDGEATSSVASQNSNKRKATEQVILFLLVMRMDLLSILLTLN